MGCTQGNTIPKCIKNYELDKRVDSILVYDEQNIILGIMDGIQIFNLKTKIFSSFSKEHKGRINVLIKLKDGRIASGGQDRKIKIWDIDSKESMITFEGHKLMIWALEELKGNKIISGGSDKRILIWDLIEKRLDFELNYKEEVTALLQLKNGNIIFCVGNNLNLFDLESKKYLANINVNPGVWAIKQLSNNNVAIGKGDGELEILEVNDEIKTKSVLKGHKKSIVSIIELKNQKLVTASDENKMIIWDLCNIENKYFIEGHTKNVVGIANLLDNTFVSISKDETLKIWE